MTNVEATRERAHEIRLLLRDWLDQEDDYYNRVRNRSVDAWVDELVNIIYEWTSESRERR